MIKDHSESERGNLLPPHGLLFPINSKGSFICTIPDRITHTTAFVTPVVEHWLEQEIAQWVHHEGLIRQPIAPRVNALTTELHLAPCRGQSLTIPEAVTASRRVRRFQSMWTCKDSFPIHRVSTFPVLGRTL